MPKNARLILLRLAIVLAVLGGATAVHAAPPVRILPPAQNSKVPRAQLVTEFLAERLGECGGIDIVRGGRAGVVSAWLHSGAFDLTEEESWKRLQSYVALDALVIIEAVPPSDAQDKSPGVIQVRIFSTRGIALLNADVPEAAGPEQLKAVTGLGERVGRELKLSDSDVRTLSAARIEDPALFRLSYTTHTAIGSWITHPYTYAFNNVASTRLAKPLPDFDAISVRVLGDYIGATNAVRGTEKLPLAQSMVRPPLLRLLGTPQESAAYGLLRLPRNPYTEPMLNDVESVLLQVSQPLIAPGKSGGAGGAGGPGGSGVSDAELDELGGVTPADKEALHDALAKPTELSSLAGKTDFTSEQRVSALRMLGVMGTPKGEAFLQRAAGSTLPQVREAVAGALAAYADDATLDALKKLLGDADENVAFSAACSMNERRQATPEARKRAADALGRGEPNRTRAALALASDATLDDAALSSRLAADESQAVRAALRATRAKQGGVAMPLASIATDTDSDAIVKAIRGAVRDSLKPGVADYDLLVRLASDPDTAVAQAARAALAPLRPADAPGRALFDLAVALPYTRQKTVAMLAGSAEPWARAALVSACDNADAHTRVAALRELTKLDPVIARGTLLTALSDAHLYVRFHAAVFLASIADASQAASIQAAIPRQKDHATALYLADAFARATGTPPPALRPGANSLAGPDTVPWLLGPLFGDVDSPCRMHYIQSHGNHVRDDAITDAAKTLHAAGTAYIYNIGPLGESGINLVDPASQDPNWIYLDDQLDTKALAFIDGIDLVNGGLEPDALWPAGWRLFCDETGIDADRVAGDKKNLGPYEADAWTVWARRVCIAGRNELYDYIKLKFGRLHPGLQVSTSIDSKLGAAGFDLKFDVSTFRSERGSDPRKSVYAAVRRAKTMWPDRPAFWVVEGLDVPNLAIMKFDFKMPAAPLVGRAYSAYADALAAWMAGADPGWSCVWVLRSWDWAEPSFNGTVVSPEDAKFDSKPLHDVIDFAFAGAEPAMRIKDAKKKADASGPAPPTAEKEKQMDGMLEAINDPEDNAMSKRIEKEKAAMYLGFQFYGKHLLDIARLFASLPRNHAHSHALLIGPADPAVGASAVDSPGADLLGDFDALSDIDDIARVDLSRYQFIAVSDPASLTDRTIADVTAWLKQTKGVLYVHGDLTGDNSRQAGTPEAFDGKLKLDWPWENDLRVTASNAKSGPLKIAPPKGEAITAMDARLGHALAVTGASAQAALLSGEAPALVVWQHADFKGAVVFDAVEGGGRDYREALRGVLNGLHEKSGVGLALNSSQRHEAIADDRWAADATDSAEPRTLSGADLLTGELNPVVGPGKSGALIGRDFQGKYAAAFNGVSVLCDRPITKVEKIEGGLRIECDGLMQAASATGGLRVRAAGGAQPATIGEENRLHWVMLENTPGVATQAIGDGKTSQPATLLYVRWRGRVDILVR